MSALIDCLVCFCDFTQQIATGSLIFVNDAIDKVSLRS